MFNEEEINHELVAAALQANHNAYIGAINLNELGYSQDTIILIFDQTREKYFHLPTEEFSNRELIDAAQEANEEGYETAKLWARMGHGQEAIIVAFDRSRAYSFAKLVEEF